jgi:hypothetical protein
LLTRPHRKGIGRELLDNAKAREASEWDGLGSKEKFSRWVARHQYKVILGSWATSMAVAGTFIMRDRYGYASLAPASLTRTPSLDTSPLLKRLSKPGCGPRD